MKLTDYMRVRSVVATQIAREAGVAHTTVLRLLNGEAIPRRKTLSRISAATLGEVSEAELIVEAHQARTVRQ